MKKKAFELRRELQKKPGPQEKRYSSLNFTPIDSTLVLQGEGVISNANNKDWLLSLCAGPCIILTIYDPVTKNGYLAHVDAGTNEQYITQSIDRFLSGIDKSNEVEVRMFAKTGDEETLYSIHDALTTHQLQGNIVEVDLFGNGDIALNLTTGEPHIIDGATALRGFPDLDQRLKLLSLSVQMPGPLMMRADSP